MNIDISYDPSVNSAPAGFTAAIAAAVQYLESIFTNPVTITIDVGYGEIDGQPIAAGDLSGSYANYVTENYSAVKSILQAENAPGASTLPSSSPFRGSVYMSLAEAQALGLSPDNGSVDGYIGFESGANIFSYSTSVPPSNEYYLIGLAEHEITEDMGRLSLLNDQPSDYALIDLFRYSSSGVRDLTTGGPGSTAYFSIDNGVTNLGSWNNNLPNGDLADWYPSGPAPGGDDAFNDYSDPGVINVVSSTDITLMEALGWTTSASALITNEVTVLYEDVLFRQPDVVGLSGWASELTSGQMTLSQLVSAFVKSPEALTVVDPIIRLYDGLFSRAPDVGGIQNWVSVEDAGASLDTIIQYFVTSAEFANDYGAINSGTAAEFIESLYHNFLGRAADPAGLADWVAALGSTPTVATEAAVIQAFVNCTEFLNDLGASVSAWLSDAVNGALASTTATALGTATYASTLDPLYSALSSDQTIGTLVVTGDDTVTFANGAYTNNTIDSLVDDGVPDTLATITVTGSAGNELTIGSIGDTALTKIDASQDAGYLAIVANQNGLTILGSTGGFILTAGGTADAISVGSDSSLANPSGFISILASGANDTISVYGGDSPEIGAPGSTNTITVAGADGTVYLTDQDVATLGIATAAMGANDTINVGDTANPGGDVDMWVGSNSTINLTPGSTALIYLKGDFTGATSNGTYALTTITGTGGADLTLHLYNVQTEAWAGGSSANSQVNEGTATSQASAIDIAANQAAVLDRQFNGGAHTTTTANPGQSAINGSTGLVDWFQYGGNTYVIEANNTGTGPATHTALGTHDVVVELVGIVDVNHMAVQFA